ncbi:MAG: glycine dehydrogenase, partial [Planctomycetota bacterium]
AALCAGLAHQCQARLCSIDGFDPRFQAPFFKEFVVESAAAPDEVAEELLQSNVLGALPLRPDYPEMEHCSLFAVTERRTETDIAMLYHALDLMTELSIDLE